MLRYTTIHHDVREHFKLSLMEYCVVFSYYQLSHKKPTTVSPDKIAEFLGCNRDTVFSAKKKALQLGIIIEEKEGITTSDEWDRNIIFSSEKSENPTKKSENPTDIQYIINKDITSEQSSRGEIVTTDDITVEVEEDLVPTKNLRKKGLPKSVEADIQKMWAFWPGPHGAWKVNKTIREYSEVLLKERGLEKVQWAVEFWLDNKHDKFCPDISTPHLLASKYESLQEYRRKKLGY